MKQFIKGWWHVISALIVVGWLAVGWVSDVNAFVGVALTPTQADKVYVRQDVLNETMLRIEAELRTLNTNFEKHFATDTTD